MDYWCFDGEYEFLPQAVMDWAKLYLRNPILRVDDNDEMFEFNEEVSTLNDEGYSFSEIADLIEAQMWVSPVLRCAGCETGTLKEHGVQNLLY